MMEIQVAAIAKQKENLERMLQSKTQYIRVRSLHTCTCTPGVCFLSLVGGGGRGEGDIRPYFRPDLHHVMYPSTQDMVTTGFKRGMEDKETSTDSSLFDSASSSKRGGATATVATQVECWVPNTRAHVDMCVHAECTLCISGISQLMVGENSFSADQETSNSQHTIKGS